MLSYLRVAAAEAREGRGLAWSFGQVAEMGGLDLLSPISGLFLPQPCLMPPLFPPSVPMDLPRVNSRLASHLAGSSGPKRLRPHSLAVLQSAGAETTRSRDNKVPGL